LRSEALTAAAAAAANDGGTGDYMYIWVASLAVPVLRSLMSVEESG